LLRRLLGESCDAKTVDLAAAEALFKSALPPLAHG
jgi:kynurenine 3-monooxygenase